MLRYNREHLSEDYVFSREHLKHIDTQKQVAIITAYTQQTYEFKFNELLLLKDFFNGLLKNSTIKELKFCSALSNRQLTALRCLIEDQKRIVKISLSDKTLPQSEGKLNTDEQFISSCLETNAKLASEKNHQFFDSAHVQLVIDNPRLFLSARFYTEIIKHPVATKISIGMPLTYKQFVNLSAILTKNTQITSVFIQGKDVLDHAREQDAGIVGLASHVYSSVKSELNEAIVELVTALGFNSCLGAIQRGENHILQIPLECTKAQTAVIVKCLQNSNNLRRLEMSEFNGQLLSQIPNESKITTIHIKTTLQDEDCHALALFLSKNSSVTDSRHS